MMNESPLLNWQLDAYSWHLLLPVGDDARVLSIAPPDVTHLQSLASLFDNVTSLRLCESPVIHPADSHAGKRERIISVQGSVIAPPFSNESFDFVVLNDFAADCSGNGRQPNWRSHHGAILKNLHRILAAGGCIGVWTRNRLNWLRLLQGANQDMTRRHRDVSTAYRGPANHFLSPGQNLAALRKAGFHDVQAYVVFPGSKAPKFVVPYDARAYRYFRRNFTYPEGPGWRKWAARRLAESGLDRFVESELLITGVKG